MDIYINCVLIVVGIYIISVIAAKMDKDFGPKAVEEVKEKACPPHKWRFIEQPGMSDTYFTRCDLCSMIPGQEGVGK
jgi:hypothetical protein